ncbi:ATP-binding protein [Aquibacillus salsiterrae]|uniref:ATP-binding protein n=1 Tax=Aquibacillus salsiterrae TaxID=2950439 RepID=A0A9X3WJQ9_9BACI|nr:ATP-binding protein [Aquibacillus salsiterrae]MDC3418336.1 ATP-binding protein [Aquibacillus salsiterrae]
MSKLLAEQVFKPASFPQYTYISRKSKDLNIDFELRLQQALKISGCLTSIVGPSKMGKTVLCEKVIDLENLIEVSGVDFNNKNEFWSIVGAKAGLPVSGLFSEVDKYEGTNSQKELNRTEKYLLNKDKVINYFKDNGLVLVLDDFHYAEEEIQLHIAQQLKDAIRKEFKAIVISLPHRADDAIRKNADLTGRLNLINMEPWQIEELEEIAKRGFNQLGVKINAELARKIAIESLTSPQLMQYICLSISTLMDLDNIQIEEISEEVLENAYKFTTVNFEYKDVVKVLKEGPNTRGKQRKIFITSKGKSLDIYGLIVESIADNPPLMGLTIDELKYRIDNIITDSDKKPDKKTIRESLNKLQAILNEKENIYRVFEWKDNTVHILDPLFLFFLRWGTH